MDFSWDSDKRNATLKVRDLDFSDADMFFDGRPAITIATPRNAEERWKTTVRMGTKFYTIVWVQRGEVTHVISMRRAHAKEERAYRDVHG